MKEIQEDATTETLPHYPLTKALWYLKVKQIALRLMNYEKNGCSGVSVL